MRNNDRKARVNGAAISYGSAGAEVISTSVFDTCTIIVIQDSISIGMGMAKGYDDDIGGDKLGVDRQIEATS